KLLEELQNGGLRNVLKNGDNRTRVKLYRYLEPISNRNRGMRPTLLNCMDIVLQTKDNYQVADHRAALELAAIVRRLDRNRMPDEKLELRVPVAQTYSIRPMAIALTGSGTVQQTTLEDCPTHPDHDQKPGE